ncbi:glycosyltransferase family 4 protein [bacterium]|nr:glycosyltransferase family 4 protein [bacterium]
MRKKLALILISLDECFTKKGFSGGGHKVTKNLVEQLVKSEKFEIDIYCKKGTTWNNTVSGINSITVFNSKHFKKDLEACLEQKAYDYILSSDVLLPFANNLLHSNSSRYKSKKCKSPLMSKVLRIYNHRKIRNQEKNISYDKSTFTVSESLKEDYVENLKLNPDKVFVTIPATDDVQAFVEPEKKDYFTLGAIAGGGLNKGGYLLLYAMSKLPKSSKIKARIIFPKIKKAGFFKLLIKLLKLEDRIELLPKQADMNEYYKTIDCYVLPSLNEAFGLVVTEAAANSKPSIVSSTTGVRELIKDNKNGFIFKREIDKIENLTNKIIEVSDLFLYNHEEYVNIAKCAHEIAESLSWKQFGDVIIENMVAE